MLQSLSTGRQQSQTLNTKNYSGGSLTFIMNGATQENRKLMLKSPNSPIQGLGWAFRGLQRTGMWKHWWGKFTGEPWSFATYDKGRKHWIFLDNVPSASQGFQYSSSSYVPALRFGGRGELWFRVQLEVKVPFPLHALAA